VMLISSITISELCFKTSYCEAAFHCDKAAQAIFRMQKMFPTNFWLVSVRLHLVMEVCAFSKDFLGFLRCISDALRHPDPHTKDVGLHPSSATPFANTGPECSNPFLWA